jgi:hypothetical protein
MPPFCTCIASRSLCAFCTAVGFPLCTAAASLTPWAPSLGTLLGLVCVYCLNGRLYSTRAVPPWVMLKVDCLVLQVQGTRYDYTE